MIIESERLILRYWNEDDAAVCYEYCKDPKVGPITGWPPHKDIEESLYIIRNVLTAPDNFAITLKQSGTVIGNVGLKYDDLACDDKENSTEIGFWLGVPHWGKGYMTEAVKAIIEYIFEDLHKETIWCGYYDGNDRSRHVQQKCGFKYQWTTPDVDVPLMNEKRTGHVNKLTRDEWLEEGGGRHARLYDTNKYRLAEAPFYDERYDRISWVDIIDGKFYTKQGSDESVCFDAGQKIGAAIPLKNTKGYVLACQDGLYTYENGKLTKTVDLKSYYESYQRSNDAKADPDGRIFFGSSVEGDHSPCGNLYSYFEGAVKVQQANTKISNGMAWSHDKTKFYFSDSLEHAVFVYDRDLVTGDITNRKVLFEINDGVPDGLCIDENGNLWVAVWDGKRIECRSHKDGKLLDVIRLDARHVTSCCFMGKDLDTLFITSSGEDLEGESDGRLFICKPGVKGVICDKATI